MAEGGWIKLHRRLMEKAIWTSSSAEQKVILITILMLANHEGKEWEWNGKQFKATSGQFVTSLESIIKKCGKGVSKQNVRSALEKFEKYEFLTQQVTKTGRLVTIVNWEGYQAKDITTNTPTNKEVTQRSHRGNKEVTPNKNDKNYKNDKKYIYIAEFTKNKLLIETIIDFMKMRDQIKKPMTDKALQIMINKLKGLSEDEEIQIKILENSIEHCWQGIFQLKEDSNGSTRQNTGANKKFKVSLPTYNPDDYRTGEGEEPI